MEYNELRIIKLFVYLSIFSSFFSGIFLVLTDFIDNQTLIEIYGNRVLFNLFIPFMIGLLMKEEVAFDINSYAKAPPSFRVWGGSTVEPDNIKKLLPWIDWAYHQVRSNYV